MENGGNGTVFSGLSIRVLGARVVVKFIFKINPLSPRHSPLSLELQLGSSV